MKGKKIFYIVLTLICMSPFMVKADCDYQRLAELSKLASNVKVSYNYDSNANFTVTLTNLTDDIYVTDNFGNTFNGSGERQVSYGSGNTVTYQVFSNDANCPGRQLGTKYITLPSFNPYYATDDCKNNPGFQYCQKWTSSVININTFDSALADYEDEISGVNDEKAEESSIWEIIVNFFEENFYIVIGLGIVILVFIVMLIIRLWPKKKR